MVQFLFISFKIVFGFPNVFPLFVMLRYLEVGRKIHHRETLTWAGGWVVGRDQNLGVFSFLVYPSCPYSVPTPTVS